MLYQESFDGSTLRNSGNPEIRISGHLYFWKCGITEFPNFGNPDIRVSEIPEIRRMRANDTDMLHIKYATYFPRYETHQNSRHRPGHFDMVLPGDVPL